MCERKKWLLVRLDDTIFVQFLPGREVAICCGDRSCRCRVQAVRRYHSIDEILANEDMNGIAHGSTEETQRYLLQIYSEPPLGKTFVVIELELRERGRKRNVRG